MKTYAALGKEFSYSKRQIANLADMTMALSKSRHIHYGRIAENLNKNTFYHSKVRSVERFFSNHPINQIDSARYILRKIPQNKKLTLIIDRSNWKRGKRIINLLMLSVLDPKTKTALPLLWMNLDHSGNSSMKKRIELMDMLLKVLPKNRIEVLLGDREFIGKNWLEFLEQNEINFVFRIRKNIYLDEIKASDWFEDLKEGKIIEIIHEVKMCECYVYVCATLSSGGDKVIVSSSIKNKNLLKIYKDRFEIECMFKNMKSSGFNLESTGIKKPEYLDRLICLLAILFLWVVEIGKNEKTTVKSHGRLEESVFRIGMRIFLDILRRLRFDLICKIISTA
ncbi:MAG TPA: IS4 family transposase [Leptospiraceae bacterium]|jgi:hypothetical protein|nr:IS4 family transposase [Leptospiraceae bacterium]